MPNTTIDQMTLDEMAAAGYRPNYVEMIPQQPPVQQPPVNYVQPAPTPVVQPRNYVQPVTPEQTEQYYREYPSIDPAQYEGDVMFGPTTITPTQTREDVRDDSVFSKRWDTYKSKNGQKGGGGKGDSPIKRYVPIPPSISQAQAGQVLDRRELPYQKEIEARQKDKDRIQQLINSGIKKQQDALSGQAKLYDDLKRDLGDVQQKEIEGVRKLREGYIDDQGNKVKGFNDKFAELLRGIDNQYKEFENEKIDNNRLFNNMGTGRKILLGIGMFLSAFSNSATKNTIGIIEKAIDRDIQAQKEEMKRKRFAITGKKNQLAILTQKYNSDVAAENALSLMQKRKVIDTIDAQIRKAKTQAEMGKLELLKAQILSGMKKNVTELSKFQQSQLNTASMMQNADELSRQVIWQTRFAQPKERKEALDKLDEFNQEKNTLKQVNSVYDRFINERETGSFAGGYFSKIPYTKSKTDQLTAMATLFAPFKALIAEAVTKGELETLFPLIPYKTDTPSQLETKKQRLMEALINRFPEKGALNRWLPANLKQKHYFINVKKPNL